MGRRPNPKRELTEKQWKFVHKYLATDNVVEAYKAAYDCSKMQSNTITTEAYRVLKLPHVVLAIERLRRQVVDALEITMMPESERKALMAQTLDLSDRKAVLTRAWVIEQLMDNALKAKAEKDFAASNRALELLGKIEELRMFSERNETTHRYNNESHAVSPFIEHLENVLELGDATTPEATVSN